MKKLFILMMTAFISSCASDPIIRNPIDSMTPPDEKRLSFTESNLLINVEQAEVYVGVGANVEFSIKLVGVNTEWASVIQSINNIRIIAKPNISEEERNLSVIIFNDEYKLSDTLNVSQAYNKERFALIKIYKALNGENWIKNKNWCTDAPMSEWEGIVASGDHGVRVIKITNDAYVEGELPLCIGDFPDLVSLYLTGTKTYGGIPKEIGKLAKLEYLDLSSNQLSGEIPSEIGGCVSLKNAIFRNNNLTGSIPQDIFQIGTIRFVSFSDNRITSFVLGGVSENCRLEYIDMDNNEISTPMPEAVFKIKSLISFSAENNSIPGNIPNTLGTTLNISIVDLSNNRLTGGLPSNISNKCAINLLDVSQNKLTETIPDSFSNLLSLTDLRLFNNDLSGKISDMVKKTNPNFSVWRINPQNNGSSLD